MTPDRPTRPTSANAADPLAAFRARARRGTPRGADEVLAAARSDRTTAPTPGPVAPRDRRWATVAAVAVAAAGLVAGGIVLGRSDDDRAVSAGHDWCAALGERAVPPEGDDPDLSVFLEPGANAAAVSEVGARLAADGRVDGTHHVDTVATYERFLRLFEGDDFEVIRRNVDPDDLPTSFEVQLVAGARPEEVVADYRRVPLVFDVITAALPRARVLDLLVATGRVPEFSPITATRTGTDQSWPARVRAASTGAPPAVADAIGRLGAELEERRSRSGEAPAADPALTRAASVLLEAAADSCGLEAAPWTVDDAAFVRSGAGSGGSQPSGSLDVIDPNEPSVTTTTAGP